MYINNQDNDFSIPLYTNKELYEQKFINEIETISQKYDILKNENELINYKERSFLHLLEYVFELCENEKEIPLDIEELFFSNYFFKEQINIFLEKKLKNLTKDSSVLFIKDIKFILFTLSIGFYKKVLTLDFKYNLENLALLFRFYENLLKNLFKENITLFALTFDTYIIIIKTFIQLCIIDSIDISKKYKIRQVIDLLIETINITKYNIPLNNYQLCKINNIQGKYLYYFSHLEEIYIDVNDLNSSFEKHLLILEKQEDGFNLAKNNDFGNENNTVKEDEFLIFRTYASLPLLKLLNYLENNISHSDYSNNPYFQKIRKRYFAIFTIDTSLTPTTKRFKQILIEALLYKYISNLNFSKRLDYNCVIEDFIFSGTNFNITNIETIYRILYFIKDIKYFQYFQIIQILTESQIIKNNYYEFFKLAIFNLFIDRLNHENLTIQEKDLLESILIYLLKNNFYHNLTSMYEKIISKLEKFHIKREYIEEKLIYNSENEIRYYLSNEDEFELNY